MYLCVVQLASPRLHRFFMKLLISMMFLKNCQDLLRLPLFWTHSVQMKAFSCMAMNCAKVQLLSQYCITTFCSEYQNGLWS